MKMQTQTRRLATAALVSTTALSAWALTMVPNAIIGGDLNSSDNPFVQPQDPALSGGGRDQSQQFGDVLSGTSEDDLVIGRLGVDFIQGFAGDDVLVGGTEHFNPANRDRAFGGTGSDIFLWSPGDGSDFFDGGPGIDVVVFGLMGELDDMGNLGFGVSMDMQAGDVFIDPVTGLPLMDVPASPGFCEVIDESSSPEAAAELAALGVDELVQFFIRGIANSFGSTQNDDNGLRVTLHLKDVEALVCTNRDGGLIEVVNLTVSPPEIIPLSDVTRRVPNLAALLR